MKKHLELCMEVISMEVINLMNYWKRTVLSVFITETFKRWLLKFFNGLSQQVMNEVFQVKLPTPYYLKDKRELYNRSPKTVAYGTDSVSFMAPKIWSIVP